MENAEILSPPDETLPIKILEINEAQVIVKAKIKFYEEKVKVIKNIDEIEKIYKRFHGR